MPEVAADIVSTAPAAEPVTPAAPPAEGGAAVQNTEGAAPPASPGEEKPATAEKPVVPPTDEKPKWRGAERKINRLYKEAAEHKARADLLQKQLDAVAPKAQDPSEPTLAQFDYDPEKYAEAKAKYATEKQAKHIEEQSRTQAQQRADQSLKAGWEEKVAKAESKFDDFDAAVGELQPTTPWARAIMRAPNGEDVAYHLAKNQKEAVRIFSLDPESQYLEIGILSAKLLAEPAKPKQPSVAPVPIKPVGGASSPSTKKLHEMSYDEFVKKRKEQMAARH